MIQYLIFTGILIVFYQIVKAINTKHKLIHTNVIKNNATPYKFHPYCKYVDYIILKEYEVYVFGDHQRNIVKIKIGNYCNEDYW